MIASAFFRPIPLSCVASVWASAVLILTTPCSIRGASGSLALVMQDRVRTVVAKIEISVALINLIMMFSFRWFLYRSESFSASSNYYARICKNEGRVSQFQA